MKYEIAEPQKFMLNYGITESQSFSISHEGKTKRRFMEIKQNTI